MVVGDLNGKCCGLSSEPVISVYELRSDDEILVVGSDGLWDMVSNQEAMAIAVQYDQPAAAARALRERAVAKWMEEVSNQGQGQGTG